MDNDQTSSQPATTTLQASLYFFLCPSRFFMNSFFLLIYLFIYFNNCVNLVIIFHMEKACGFTLPGAVPTVIKVNDDGENKTRGSDQLGSQNKHREGFKSWRKRPRKQPNPRSTYPHFYDFSRNDPKKSSGMDNATMGWGVTPKRPRSKKIEVNLKPLKPIETKKQQPKKRKVASSVNLYEPAETTDEFKDYISNQLNGSELKFVIKKKLFKTDIIRNNNRFSMPVLQLRTQDFLTVQEKQHLAGNGEIAVALVGPDLVEYKESMVLKRWHMNSSYHYVLRTNWYNFTVAHSLKEDTKVEVWSFRRENKLCFALARV